MRGRLWEQRGLTLIELLVALLVTLVVIVVPLAWIMVSIKQSTGASSRALSASQAEAGLLALTRDLREVSPGTTATFTWGSTGASATFSIPTAGSPGTPATVSWSCTFGSSGVCTRQVGTGAPIPQIRGVLSLSFAPTDAAGNALPSPATDPAYVGITLQVANASSPDRTPIAPLSNKPITLADGAFLRNSG